jgi:hypothetical protein
MEWASMPEVRHLFSSAQCHQHSLHRVPRIWPEDHETTCAYLQFGTRVFRAHPQGVIFWIRNQDTTYARSAASVSSVKST